MFGLVSKKKLENAIHNNKMLNEQRMMLEKENKFLQARLQIADNSCNFDLDITTSCKKCGKPFVPQRENQTYCQHCINKRHKKGE